MNLIVSALIGILAGSATVIQGALNASLGSPLASCFRNFIVGSAFLIAVSIAAGVSPFTAMSPAVGPWWSWSAGVFGASLVVAITFLIPAIGAANTFVLVVAGQAITSLVFDHYGWLGVQEHPASITRIMGMLLLILGVFFVRR